MSLEDIFNSTKLDVIVSEKVFDLPDSNVDDWLQSITSSHQREKAFFDERLLLFFVVKIPHPGPPCIDPLVPPSELVLFLSHLQVTLDAKYISPQPAHRARIAISAHDISLAPPPRSHSYHKSPEAPFSIFPPYTPNPTPQTAESDRKYASANLNMEGTVLESFVWGDTSREEPAGKNFALMWSDIDKVWVAIYRLAVSVSFLRTSVAEPLLSLTVSSTLREKPLAMTPGRKDLASLLQAVGGLLNDGDQPTTATANGFDEPSIQEDELHGLEEVNLLAGLSQDLTFRGSGIIPPSFPSTRLGGNLRRSAYSLPPAHPILPKVMSPSAVSSVANAPRTAVPVLRKSYLKTLQTVSGFHIRMKSVFVPYVVLPDHAEDEGERREAGSEERTVVLSVELGNGSSSEGPGSTGFSVEEVDVTVGGEGAKANLIGWGEQGLYQSNNVFPLLLGPAEQYNLLYAITFLRQSEADEVADTLRSEAIGEKLPSPSGSDKQRPVAIVIRGKPFDFWSSKRSNLIETKDLVYPTRTFRSRWNCVLDLSSASHGEPLKPSSHLPSANDALPAPASPFPDMTSNTTKHPLDKAPAVQAYAVAGSKRHATGGPFVRAQRNPPSGNSTAVLSTSHTESPISSAPIFSAVGGRFAPTPPSVAVSTHSRFATPIMATNMSSPHLNPRASDIPPLTPAYPAYPTEPVPQTPGGQSPLSNHRMSETLAQAIEPRRERMVAGGPPQTPGPRVLGASFANRMAMQDDLDAVDPFVISVGLLPPESASSHQDVIYSLDTFGIEIFVFNRSERTRRFEVSYPDQRRRRHQAVAEDLGAKYEYRKPPGILPLENRIRVGPLRPHTCQSVRMQFLALRSGVHSISSLTMTDVESGYSRNLKSVMEVMIHEIDQS